MATDDTPELIQVPVKRYDVNLTLDDILGPLMQLSTRRTQEVSATASPELDQHLQQLSDLARQLQELVNRINEIDPVLLAPTKRRDPPNT